MSGYIYLSREGLEKMKKELKELKQVKRPELSRKIAEARDFGDLKENAEYHAAKEALAFLENRIVQLEETVRKVKILSKDELVEGKVTILSSVKLKDLINDKEIEYSLVAPEESDFKSRKISTTSPVGKALLGKQIDDIVEINVPAGSLKYKVLDIKTLI